MNPITSPIVLIKSALSLFFKKENLLYFVKIVLPLLPLSIISIAQDTFMGNISSSAGTQDPSLAVWFSGNSWFVWVVGAFNILYFIANFFVAIAIIIASRDVVSGVKQDVKVVFATTWKILGKYLVLSSVTGALIVLGTILLIIPGIVFMIWFAFAKFEFVLDGVGVVDSIRKSKSLVAGKFWKVLGRLFVIGIFGILVQVVFAFVPYVGPLFYPLLGVLFTLPTYLLYLDLKGQIQS